jgi:hypothetical protein
VTRKDAAGPLYRHLLTSKYTFEGYVERGMRRARSRDGSCIGAMLAHVRERARRTGRIHSSGPDAPIQR